MARPRIHVALLQPRIPHNTGQIGRSCLGFGNCALHLVGPLGFSLDAKQVKRSGLDYWDRVDVTHHEDWHNFRDGALRDLSRTGNVVVISKREKYGTAAIDEATLFRPGDETLTMVFGNEVSGMEDVLAVDPDALPHVTSPRLFIPMDTGGDEMETGGGVRSFNLATSVGIGLYEAGRQLRDLERHASSSERIRYM